MIERALHYDKALAARMAQIGCPLDNETDLVPSGMVLRISSGVRLNSPGMYSYMYIRVVG